MTRGNNNDDADEPAVATALDGETVRGERNMLADTAVPGFKGALAALETFYYAFNTRSVDLLKQIWAEDPLAQIVTPLVSHIRGSTGIAAAYGRMPSGPVEMQTVLDEIVAYITSGVVVFTMRERATVRQHSEHDGMTDRLEGRTSCIFRFIASQGGWRLIYHQVSLSDPETLARIQRGVRG
jgi:ketosteroid isomerase-like protein